MPALPMYPASYPAPIYPEVEDEEEEGKPKQAAPPFEEEEEGKPKQAVPPFEEEEDGKSDEYFVLRPRTKKSEKSKASGMAREHRRTGAVVGRREDNDDDEMRPTGRTRTKTLHCPARCNVKR